jgi:tetratricopeptide (TPR) repeat protein
MATLASDLQVQPAEQFYCHALTNEGRDTAIEPLQSESKSNLVSLAVSYFHRGCELWAQDDLSYALSQLKLSKSIWERYSPSLTFLLQAFGNDSKSSEQELAGNTEYVAQLYYALGTVHLSMKHCLDALKSFRSALQVTALGLGVEHDLFGAILYMMRLTLLTMGFSSPKIHEYIKHFRRELTKESRADMYAAAGRIEKALMKYEALSFVWDSDWQAKARVKTKIATMHEENGNLLKATREWSIISALYKEVANLDKENPLRQMTREKEMILFNTLDRIEI